MRTVIFASLCLALASMTACDKFKRSGDDTPDPGKGTTPSAAGKLGTGAPITGEPVTTECDLRAHDLAENAHAVDGKTFLVRCPSGCTNTSVWGTDVYTDDSPVCLAAVHAGATATSGGTVAVTFARGQVAYRGSARNGVTSASYGKWPRSFYVQALDDKGRAVGAPPTLYDDKTAELECGASNPFEGKSGTFTVICVSDCTSGSVWGNNPYTGDSSVCAAGHHAGLLSDSTRKFKITLGGPRESFKGTTSHGVTSNEYAHFDSSFTLSKE